jgi:hypothetical protein
MKRSGRIIGNVEFRSGDGPRISIRHGRVEIETTQTEATLSWVEEDTHGVATIPLAEVREYIRQGAIEVHASGKGEVGPADAL